MVHPGNLGDLCSAINMTFTKIKTDLKQYIKPKKVPIYMNFFKTAKGQYGEGDRFFGIAMPHIRKVARQYKDVDFDTIKKLLESPYHEHRMTGLLILVYKFETIATPVKTGHAPSQRTSQRDIYNFYIKNIQHVNNWDLVDVTTPNIMGQYLYDHPDKKDILYSYARSNNLWKKRVAILATFRFIKHDDFADTLKIATILLHDDHDLIHKAVGWMLREVGKRDEAQLCTFLDKHYKTMPRTMLRYAIERLTQEQRTYYMKK